MKNLVMPARYAAVETAQSGNLLKRALRRLRLPVREPSSIEEQAALNRAERLFEVNFRSTWTR